MDKYIKISERTIKALGKIVTGYENISPYRSGPNLVSLFNELGLNDVYGQGFPSRWAYAEESIRKINGKAELFLLMEMVFDPREFLDTNCKLENALEYFNKYLAYEKHEISIVNGYAKVRDLQGVDVEFVHPFQGSRTDKHVFIDEQVGKCDAKIASGDYYGAITNARSLLEAVLTEIEFSLDNSAPEYDGDLVKLYRRVSKLINLGPDRKDISDTLKQILSGLNSIVSGLAGLRNKMSDAHVATYKPSKHHAKLAVNAAKTVADFLFESKQYQQLSGRK
jgi:Abortive infection C-terminus